MTRKFTHNKKRRLLTLLSILLLLNISLFFQINFLNSNDSTTTLEEQFDNELLSISNGIGEDYWWNASYQWRQCINITNPGGYSLTNNFISVSFDYSTLVAESKMQSDLDDVRIVENGVIRNYYIVKDYPSINTATVWFETNSISSSSEYDTYMYFGNSTVGRATNYYTINHPAGTSWWKFEEGSGTNAIDSLGNYNGTLRGGLPTYESTDPAIGNWNLDFDGSSDYISINDKFFQGQNIINAVTVSVWFKTNFHGSSYSDNWAFFDYDRSDYFNFFIRGDDGRIGFSSSATGYSGQNDFYGDTLDLNDGEWHFACIVYDGTDKMIFIDDGVMDAIWENAMGGRAFGTGTTRYGFIGDGSEATTDNGGRNNIYYDGEMDDLRYFDYAVSPNEIKWLANYYPLTTNLLAVTERAATVTIIVKDIDGRRVPGAEVSLWENLTHILNIPGMGEFTQNSSADGIVVFTGVPFGKYNITTNYTLNSVTYKEEYVYDSRTQIDGEVEFKGLIITHTIYVNLWTIDFEVDDWDGDPLNYGYININESGQVIEKLTLDVDGKATFRWLNSSSGYNYTLYYDNADYPTYNPTLLNWSTITRKDIKSTYLVHEENTDSPSASTYSVNVDTFLEGSSYANPGNITVIDASIDLNGMDNMTQVRIWYLDDTGHRFKELKDYSGLATADTFTYHPEEEETYEVYGLRVEIDGENTTTCNGVIEVSLTYAYNQYIKTQMSKLNIKVLDDTETIPVEGVTVRIENNETKEIVAILKTDDNGEAYGQINDNLGFWYKTGWTYNFSLWIVSEQRTFRVNYSDQYFNPSNLVFLDYYNYTLNSASSLIFELDLNYQNRISEFKNGTLFADVEVMWGQNMSFSINYTTSLNGGANWIGDDGVGSTITCTIKSTKFGNPKLFSSPMTFLGNGNYSIMINSSQFSAGDSGKSYIVVISGSKLYYNSPPNEIFLISIHSLPTGMSVHDYTTLSELPSNDISQYFNELMNITLKYYDDTSNDPLIADSFTYTWDYGSGSVGIDPINPGFYTLEIDTSTVSNTGLYKFYFSSKLENHTKIDNFLMNVFIMERPSKLNGSIGVSFYSEDVYALNSQNYSFDYFDVLTDTAIANADGTAYTWQKLDEFGNPIPGDTGSGSLIETLTHAYILDLNTEFMTLGDYFIYVTLNKLNFEQRAAVMALEITDRPTLLNGSSSFIPSAININLGKALNISFSYVDSLTSLDIINLDNQSYTYTSNIPSSGMGTLVFDANTNLYVLDFGTVSKLNGTYTIIVTLDKENYTKQTCTITLIISKVQDNYQSYLTLISKNPLNLLTEVFWRDMISITFNFSTTEDGGSSIYLNNSNSITLQFRDESLNPIGAPINLIDYNTSKGVYTYTFNTSEFLFIGGNTYQFEVRAGKSDYNPADPLIIAFKVLAVTTDLTIHDYISGIEFPSYTISKYWNTTFGITLYYTESVSSAPISNAYITFNWFYGSGQVLPDATKGAGYYSFFFDTGNASEVSSYTITFLATKENYSNGIPVSNFIVNVINRPTMLNTNENVLYISQKIYVQEAHNFTFEFIDFLTSNLIESADVMSFVLQKLDANGDPIPGESILGTLFETLTHRYVLDLNTETLAHGEYSIVVTINKDNYDFRVSIISLTINKRVFATEISRTTLMEIESSGALEFLVTLTDPNNSSVPVIGATLYVTMQGTRYDLTDNGDGTYSLNIAFIADAFFMPVTIPGILTIERANFMTSEISLTVVVKMSEIFPGMPTFYFLMIVGAIVAVVGSLVGYRVIQQAKIPKFVKKARAMKKEIKGRKSISDSLLYPSKEEFIVKKFGDKWNMLGLSLESSLGLESTKRKKVPENTEPKGGAE